MNIPMRQVVSVAVLIGVPVASYFLVFQPQSKEMKKIKAENEVKRQMLAKLQTVTAQAPDLVKATEEIKQTITAIEARMPSSKELDSVLRDVATIATKCGLRVPKFNRTEGAREAGSAQEQQLDVEIVGNFDGFYKFLLDIEKLPRITRLTDMQLARIVDMEKGTEGHMRANFKLSIYYQNSTPKVADASATGAK